MFSLSIILSFGISVMFLFAIILFLIKQKYDLEKQITQSSISLNNDFMQKMEFFLNQINNSKNETNQQTISVVEPVAKTLEKLQKHIDEIEKLRVNRENSLNQNIGKLVNLQDEIKKETTKMMNVFKKPNTRGKWGEVQLQRIVEMTGMLPFCEFSLQNTDYDGIRPDMTVKLPNGGIIFIDAKTPLEAHTKLLETEEFEQDTIKKENLKAIKNHIYLLSNKKYWEKGRSPDFVVMFIPLEHTWLSALEEDPKLMDYAVEKNVIVSTPMTLIGLLKTVYIGWKQVKFAEEAENLKKSLFVIEDYVKQINKMIFEIQKQHSNLGDKISQSYGVLNLLQLETSKYSDITLDKSLGQISYSAQDNSVANNNQNEHHNDSINQKPNYQNEHYNDSINQKTNYQNEHYNESINHKPNYQNEHYNDSINHKLNYQNEHHNESINQKPNYQNEHHNESINHKPNYQNEYHNDSMNQKPNYQNEYHNDSINHKLNPTEEEKTLTVEIFENNQKENIKFADENIELKVLQDKLSKLMNL